MNPTENIGSATDQIGSAIGHMPSVISSSVMHQMPTDTVAVQPSQITVINSDV